MRYIDDGNYVAEKAPLGMRYVRGKFIIKTELVEAFSTERATMAKRTFSL